MLGFGRIWDDITPPLSSYWFSGSTEYGYSGGYYSPTLFEVASLDEVSADSTGASWTVSTSSSTGGKSGIGQVVVHDDAK